ncbi:MAG: GFA family protein, partial [Albidovulum sp.]|uniref:GFA family protein n=1 Tax=Albidovulum sp. TaxID=1872424 RepID=UPI003C919A3C
DYYACEGPPPALPAERPDHLDCACLCGAVAFSLPGPAGDITACHCGQCRKLSGHYSASFDADEATLTWHGKAGLAEYQTPGRGRRGFCDRCGSSLYFRSAAGEFSVEAGAVTDPTGGRLADHIFVADRGDYYDITDGLPQSDGYAPQSK